MRFERESHDPTTISNYWGDVLAKQGLMELAVSSVKNLLTNGPLLPADAKKIKSRKWRNAQPEHAPCRAENSSCRTQT